MAKLHGQQLALTAARAAENKKAYDVLVLDMRKVMVDADYFVICSASSRPQLQAITREVLDETSLVEAWPVNQKGRNNNAWILLDYQDVIVHIFLNEEREYYSLEKLWADAKRIPINEH